MSGYEIGKMYRKPGCTCTELQLYRVGCECRLAFEPKALAVFGKSDAVRAEYGSASDHAEFTSLLLENGETVAIYSIDTLPELSASYRAAQGEGLECEWVG